MTSSPDGTLRAFTNKRVLLGVTGGIAAYKAAALARLFAQSGAETNVVMTASARQFIGETTFQALTGREVHSELFGTSHALDHIRLAESADIIVIAPATADFLARMASGRADDLLAATVLASISPVLVAPAMNDRMWAKPATARNVEQLRQDGVFVVGPDVGPLAAGEGEGEGRMADPAVILSHAARVLSSSGPLRGKHVVVTAGSTREALDPVRFISNRSSGRMGVAIAEIAWSRGAEVTLIAGAMSVAPPTGAEVVRVGSTVEMLDAVRTALASADALVMAAAPADFRSDSVAGQKIKKGKAPDAIALVPNPDILVSTVDARRSGCITIGFALETENGIEHAKGKLRAKQLDMIVLNSGSEPDAGFEVGTNRVTFIDAHDRLVEHPVLPKEDVAELILDELEGLVRARNA